MARSDKVPFRREFSVTSDQWLASDDGFVVGDVLSLHVHVIDGTDTGVLVEGRVGRTSAWTLLEKHTGSGHFPEIDVRDWEYVRIFASGVPSTGADFIIFGYDTPVISAI